MKSGTGKEFNPSYVGLRSDVLRLVPRSAVNILDVGCGAGTLGGQIKSVNGKANVVGIEKDKDMAAEAEKKLDSVVRGDLDSAKLRDLLKGETFDCIIFADVLEHLRDPWDVLRESIRLLRDDGVVIASIPNIRHYTTILNLIFLGRWPHRERGLHDRTHLRFFTFSGIRKMFADSGLKIVKTRRNLRLLESPHPVNRLAWIFGIPILRDFFTFQYIVVAKKTPGGGHEKTSG